MGRMKEDRPVLLPANPPAPAHGMCHNRPPQEEALGWFLEDLQQVSVPVVEKINALLSGPGSRVPATFDDLSTTQKGISLALILKDLIDTLEILGEQNRKPLTEMAKMMKGNSDNWAEPARTLYREVRQKIAGFIDTLPEGEQVRTEYGELAIVRDHWMIEVTEADRVPAPYRSPDIALLRAAVKAGVRDMPGTRIWREPQLVLMDQKP